MTDRFYTIAFIVSIVVHLSFITGKVFQFDWNLKEKVPDSGKNFEVVYTEVAEGEKEQDVHERIKQIREKLSVPSAIPNPGDGGQVKVVSRPSLIEERIANEVFEPRAAVIDLEDIALASQGDPVSRLFLTSLRENIQMTASLTRDIPYGEALIYVWFDLMADGRILNARVDHGRSVGTPAQKEVAVEIMSKASWNQPFPPSWKVEVQTCSIGLEFQQY